MSAFHCTDPAGVKMRVAHGIFNAGQCGNFVDNPFILKGKGYVCDERVELVKRLGCIFFLAKTIEQPHLS